MGRPGLRQRDGEQDEPGDRKPDPAPLAAGMVLFGDGLPSGVLGVARVLSFAAVVAGAALLTRGGGLPLEVVPATPMSAR